MELLTTLEESDSVQRLDLYIANHYAQPLSLGGIAQALNMSVSRLCALASGIAPGMTVMRLLTSRRMAAAQALLKDSDSPIREVASRVGIPDYNYFTKVFKRKWARPPQPGAGSRRQPQASRSITSFNSKRPRTISSSRRTKAAPFLMARLAPSRLPAMPKAAAGRARA